MDLTTGFQTDEPRAFVPWTTSQADLRSLFGSALREVTHGYFTLGCVSLGGMEHALGFHFEPRQSDQLRELEFFRREAMPLPDSFDDFQRHFEATFGPPARSGPGPEGFPTHEWFFGRVRIIHLVQERFGPEEHMRIQYLGPEA